MQVFNCFFKIVKNNKIGVITYVVIFMILSIMFTTVSFSSETGEYKETRIKAAVIDRDQSQLSKALTNYLGEKHDLVTIKHDKESMQDNLFARAVEYILIIPENFQDKLVGGQEISTENVKVPGSYSGFYVDNQITQYLKGIRAYLAADTPLAVAISNVTDDLEVKGQVSFLEETVKTDMSSVYHYLRYLPYVFIAVFICGMGPVLLAYQKTDIKKRNECSSMSLFERNKQLILACMVFSLTVWVGFILMGGILFFKDIRDPNLIYGLLNSAAFLLVSVAIAYLVGMLAKNRDSITAMVNTVSLGLCFLGGVFVPLSIMSEKVLAFSKFLPSYWYIKVNTILGTSVNMSSEVISSVMWGILIQAMFAAAIFALALVLIKVRRSS